MLKEILTEWRSSIMGAFLILVWLAVVLQLPERISDPVVGLLMVGGLVLLKARDSWFGMGGKKE